MCNLSPLQFHGDTIFCIDYQGQPFTPMRPIVENMGLAWQSQAAKLNANKERWTVTMIVTVAQDGIEREMLSMPVRKLPAYLASINPKKVRPELRSKIELYQAESDDALWAYWVEGRAERPVVKSVPLTPSTTSSRKPLEKLVKVWASQSGTPHAQCWTMLNAAFNLRSIAELPEEWIPDAIIWVQGKIDALPKGLPEHQAPELPQSAGRAAVLPGIPFSAAELAKLDALADRVEALNARFRVEHNALFKELVDLIHKRVTDNQFRMLSSLIWSSLERAVIAAPNILKDRCLFGDINPALLLKILAAPRS